MDISGQFHPLAAVPLVPNEQEVGWAPEPD